MSFFALNEKNIAFGKWAKRMSRMKRGIDGDMVYVIKERREVHVRLIPEWESDVRAYREWLEPGATNWLL